MNRVTSIALVSLLVSIGPSAIAETTVPIRVINAPPQTSTEMCTPLQVAGTPGEISVEKSISPLSILAVRHNWNTDFTVTNRASRYLATVRAKSRGDYKIAVYLKYTNSAPDKVFEQDVALQDNDVLVVSGSPRTDQTPYEVNVFVGGNLAAGNRYIASASACNQPEVAPETETPPEGPAPAPSPDVAPAPSSTPPPKTPQPAPR